MKNENQEDGLENFEPFFTAKEKKQEIDYNKEDFKIGKEYVITWKTFPFDKRVLKIKHQRDIKNLKERRFWIFKEDQ